MIPKGSVAIDGNTNYKEILKSSFRLTIIPHTIQNTLFRNYKSRK